MGRRPAEFDGWPVSLAVGYGPYRAVVRHIIDGDTFDCFVDLGWNDYRYQAVRLLGCDTPEINRPDTKVAGLAARDFVKSVMPPGSRVVLYTKQDPDSFGRYLARIKLENGLDLTDVLLSAGHAEPA